MNTNWSHLANAISFYEHLGYRYVELPWTVPEQAIHATFRGDSFHCNDGMLVGSAEQSFIAADMVGKLGKGRFVSCTPCFRIEQEDALRRRMFMKVELYANDTVDDAALHRMMAHASAFFADALHRHKKPFDANIVVQTAEGWDIEIGGIEVGSYGLRHHQNLSWVYGTGCAEPRLSMALAALNDTRLASALREWWQPNVEVGADTRFHEILARHGLTVRELSNES